MKPEQIKELRYRARLTQAELAELLGVGTSVVNGWENGKKNMSRQSGQHLELFAAAYDVLDWLESSVEYGTFTPEIVGFAESALSNPMFSKLREKFKKEKSC